MNPLQAVRTRVVEKKRKQTPVTRQLDQEKALSRRDESGNAERNWQMPEQLRAHRSTCERQRNQEHSRAKKPGDARNRRPVPWQVNQPPADRIKLF